MSKRKKHYDIEHDYTYYGYNIDVSKEVNIIQERDPTEQYSHEETDSSWAISDQIMPVYEGDPCDIACPFEVKENTQYYAVYVTYHDGDSFSLHSNNNLEFIDLFTTKEKALKLVDIIENCRNDGVFEYLNEVGEIRKPYAQWQNYFSGLGSCDIKEVTGYSLSKKIKYTI